VSTGADPDPVSQFSDPDLMQAFIEEHRQDLSSLPGPASPRRPTRRPASAIYAARVPGRLLVLAGLMLAVIAVILAIYLH
jgi:hypothetical protein